MRSLKKITTINFLKVVLRSKPARSNLVFPAILTVVLLALTVFRINGSSIGTYHELFYGKVNDNNLIAGRPQGIRSDEWLLNTQMTLAQYNNNFKKINENIGNGQDISILADAPYKDWSMLFKPHNLAFFVLPFDYAFAFKWWLMAYLLLLSCYFFTLALLPGKRLLASLLSIAFLFSPFIQWWYLYGTLGPLYYAFFSAIIVIYILKSRKFHHELLWALLLAYVGVCFILVLYPPFQIPIAIGLIAFCLGYFLEQRPLLYRKALLRKVAALCLTLLTVATISLLYVKSHSEVISAVQNTAYPGKRIVKSGGFDLVHLFSSHLSAQHQSISKSGLYSIPKVGLTNQSENSNFILLFPFLLLPSVYLLFINYKKSRKVDWCLGLVNACILLLLIWIFVPNIPLIGKLTLLEIAPHARTLVGFGLLNFMSLVLFIRAYANEKFKFPHIAIVVYALIVFAIQMLLGIYTYNRMPGFISLGRVVLYSIPFTLIIYLTLRKRFILAGITLASTAILMSLRVNPLYLGTSVIRSNDISLAIQEIANKDEDGVWATEHFLLENYVFMNGARSLTGVYSYPQLSIWRDADPTAKESDYNRYAHMIFSFDRNPNVQIDTKLNLTGGDSFAVHTEPCSPFLKKYNVRYILASAEFTADESCLGLLKQINYPKQTIYLYQLMY